MAQILDHDLIRTQSKYPWDEWLDGKPRRLQQGEDFTVPVVTIRAHAYAMAKKRGISIFTTAGPDYVELQARI